jgi:thiol:disulfide interchange protein
VLIFHPQNLAVLTFWFCRDDQQPAKQIGTTFMKSIQFFMTTLASMVLISITHASPLNVDTINPSTVMAFIQGHSALVYLSAFFGIGILLAFTPCVLPMIPILSGIIVGQASLSTSKAFKLSLSYVLGMAVTYAMAGMLASWMGSTLQTAMQTPAIIISFSFILVLMALSMFDLFQIQLPTGIRSRLSAVSQKGGGKNYLSVGLMGVVSTLVVSPCVTAPLIGVLSYIGQQGEVAMGGLILFVMALGMGIPLLLVGAGYGKILPKTGSWMVKIKHFFGYIMLIIAIWMLSRILPKTMVNLLLSAILIGGSVSMGSLQTQYHKIGMFFQSLGVLVIIAGAVLAYHTAASEYFVPKNTQLVKQPFTTVHNGSELNEKLNDAKLKGKPVFVEFYAGWCSDCQSMDKGVFNQPDVQNLMAGFKSIRVDISENTDEVKRIKHKYAIYGIPAMLFFDSKGNRIDSSTSAGLVSTPKMLALLEEAKGLS